MSEPEPRDLAGEATEREAYLRRLRADISPEEANEEMAERDALEQAGWDDEDYLGDPDEYDICQHCHDDGMDPDCDYLLPCPVCQGEQTP